jgi:TPR repeat protein
MRVNLQRVVLLGLISIVKTNFQRRIGTFASTSPRSLRENSGPRHLANQWLESMWALLILALGCVLCTSALAGPLDDAEAAYNRKDYAKAVELWRPLAEQRNPIAQFKLGEMYLDGIGVAKDCDSAFLWLRLSAVQENAHAQHLLAMTYMLGSCALVNLAKATYWQTKSANHGLPDAQLSLGAQYSAGIGVPRDLIKAYMWFGLAIKGSSQNDYIGTLAKAQSGYAAKEMTPEDIAAAQRLMADWHPQ